MTEQKKKRGRPLGSGKKKETVPLPDGITEISRSLNTKGGFAIDIEKIDMSSIPDNFNTLSKIDKLKWFTAHPRK